MAATTKAQQAFVMAKLEELSAYMQGQGVAADQVAGMALGWGAGTVARVSGLEAAKKALAMAQAAVERPGSGQAN